MTELLPCPFCGGEGRWNWNHDYILCGSCDIAVRPSIWATRTAPAKGASYVCVVCGSENGMCCNAIDGNEAPGADRVPLTAMQAGAKAIIPYYQTKDEAKPRAAWDAFWNAYEAALAQKESDRG